MLELNESLRDKTTGMDCLVADKKKKMLLVGLVASKSSLEGNSFVWLGDKLPLVVEDKLPWEEEGKSSLAALELVTWLANNDLRQRGRETLLALECIRCDIRRVIVRARNVVVPWLEDKFCLAANIAQLVDAKLSARCKNLVQLTPNPNKLKP